MANFTATQGTESGVPLTYAAAAAAGDAFDNTGLSVVVFKNSSNANAYDITPTVQKSSVSKSGWGTLTKSAPAALSLPAANTAVIAFASFYVIPFNNPSGNVEFTYSGSAPATDITAAVVKFADGRN